MNPQRVSVLADLLKHLDEPRVRVGESRVELGNYLDIGTALTHGAFKDNKQFAEMKHRFKTMGEAIKTCVEAQIHAYRVEIEKILKEEVGK